MNRLLISRLLATTLLLMTSVGVRASDLCNNTNGDAVENQPSPRNMACTFFKPVRVTEIVTYHWNNGRGKTPGTLSLKSNATGKIYGPFQAKGSSGQGGAPNVNWVADVDLCLPAGGYLILDSDWATWSMNAKSAYRGFVILRGEYDNCSSSGSPAPKPAPPTGKPPAGKPPTGKPPVPAPKPPTINLPPPGGAKPPSINCFLNSGAAAPKTTPCKGPAGTILGVFMPTTQKYEMMVFKSYGYGDVTVALDGSGAIRYATAPKSLCVTTTPSSPLWSVYVEGRGLPPIGPVGGFSMTKCGGTLPKVLPPPQPFPGNNPPPGLGSIKPCYVNTYAIAAVGPCFGPPGSTLAVQIYQPKRGPFSILVFKTVVTNGVPAVVTAPLVGSGSVLMATAPRQLCVAKAPAKWQVWLAGPTKSLGQIGDFSITGCP